MNISLSSVNTYLICVWGAFIVLSGNIFISDNIIKVIYILKYVTPGLLLISLMYLQLKRGKINKVLIISSLFPIYALFVLISSNVLSFELTAVYFVWSIMMFDVSKNVFNYIKNNTIKYFYFSLIIMETIVIYIGLKNNRIFWFDGSLVFSIKNPNFFGDLTAISVIISIYLMNQEIKLFKKILYLIMILLNLLLTIGSRSTSSLILIVSFTLLVWIQGLGYFKKICIIFLMTLLIVVFVFWLPGQSFETINEISTGRLLIWKMNIQNNISNSIQLLFGNAKMIVVGYPKGNFDDFVKIEHIDNTYLEIFIRYGAIGLLLCFLPLMCILNKYEVITMKKINKYSVKFSNAVIIAIILQGFYETNMPSLGNLMNLIMFLSIGALGNSSIKRHQTHIPAK